MFLFIFLFSSGIPAFSQFSQPASAIQPAPVMQPWWFTMEQGKRFFRSGSYGDALMAFEDARRARLAHFSGMEEAFISFLSNPEVRWLGDSLDFIERFIDSRNDAAAAKILSELYYHCPKENLGGSVKNALLELDRLKRYPEAEYWLGETYRVEGELALAFSQYERAWKDRAILEVSGFEVDILYKITDIHRIRGEFTEMERRAREIIEGTGSSGVPRDSLWTVGSGDSRNLMHAAMFRILETDGITRFLTIYRHNNLITEKAHRLLGFYYYSRGRYNSAAEHLMFAFLIQNTVLIEEIIRREFDYTFTSLQDLMTIARATPGLLSFIEETEYYKTVYYFSSALSANGRSNPAQQLWNFLAANNEAGEWGKRAGRSRTPVIERPE